MKKLLPLIILIFAVSAFGQKLPKDIVAEYNKFDDRTEVSYTAYWIPASRNRTVSVMVTFTHDGKTLGTDISGFWFSVFGECRTSYCFDRDDELVFLLDGERLKVEAKPVIRIADDSTGFEMTRAEFAKLAAAKAVEFKVGHFQVTLKPKEIANFKTMLDLGTVKTK